MGNRPNAAAHSKPITRVIATLVKVPSSTYSVSFLSWCLVRSPKRKIDFAAIRNPIAENWFNNTKVSINTLSRYPMRCPAKDRVCCASVLMVGGSLG